MSLLYAKTYKQAGGDYATDLVNASGKSWTAAQWRDEGVASTGRPPKFVNYRGDTLVVGAYSRVLIRYGHNRKIVPAGINPPGSIGVVEGAGGGGSSGNVLAFCTFVQKEDDGRLVAESDRSDIIELDGMTGKGYVWTLATTGADQRVTHVRGYRSVNGSDYMMAFEVAYGTATVTENVLTGDLTLIGPDQGANALPPVGVFYAVEFAGSIWYARTPTNPYRIWRSKIGYPEYVAPLDYRDTDGRETILSIARTPNDELLVLTADMTYIVRRTGNGTQTEYVMDRFDSSVGCVANAGVVEMHRKLWVPGKSGFAIYDGSFKNVMPDVRPLWASDYIANPLAYGMGFGIDDRQNKMLYFFTPRLTPTTWEGYSCGTVVWVAAYELFEPALGGTQAQPSWSHDIFGGRVASALYSASGDIYLGFCDGQIRKFDPTNGDDDGDTLAKPGIIRHGHNLYGLPGDDTESGGKKLAELWAYIESETTPWTIRVLGGDEQAYRQLVPDNVRKFWKADVAASLEAANVTDSDGVTRYVQALPKTVHYFTPERVSGRGHTIEIRMLSAIGMAYRGYGGKLIPAAGDRRAEFETNFTIALKWRFTSEGGEWSNFPLVTTMDEPAPPYTPWDLDIQTTVTYAFGSAATPIILNLHFTGAHMPADVVGKSIGGSLVDVSTVTFTDITSGTVSASAVDHNGVQANANATGAITVTHG